RRGAIPRTTKIFVARLESTGERLGFLIMRDLRPCGFVRSGELHDWGVAKRISIEPDLLGDRFVAGCYVDDLRERTLFGRYIDLPWHLYRCVYVPLNPRGIEQPLPDGFDYARFSVMIERSETSCRFWYYKLDESALRPAWLTALQKKSGSLAVPITP